MKHWLYGAIIFIILLIFLFGMLLTVYLIKQIDCTEFINSTSLKPSKTVSKNFLLSNNNKILTINKNNETIKNLNSNNNFQQKHLFKNFNKILTLRSRQKCKKF